MQYSQARRYLEVEIKTATPVELVVLLYDSAIANLQKAQEHVIQGDIAKRVTCINRVIAILTELEANLNFDAGGQISASLERLYRYMKNLVFQANLHQDAVPLKECARLMTTLRSAWAEVARTEARNAAPAAKPMPALPLSGSMAPGSQLANLNITA